MSHDTETDSYRTVPDPELTGRREPVRSGPGWAWTCHLWKSVEGGHTPCYVGEDGYLTRWGARRVQSRHLLTHAQEEPMAVRIDASEVADQLAAGAFSRSEWDPADCSPDRGCWEPGYRVLQHDPLLVYVVHDGPRETDYIGRYILLLRSAGYHVTLQQQLLSGGFRLAVTQPTAAPTVRTSAPGGPHA